MLFVHNFIFAEEDVRMKYLSYSNIPCIGFVLLLHITLIYNNLKSKTDYWFFKSKI